MMGKLFDGDRRLRSGWRFLLAVAAVIGSFFVAMLVASLVTRRIAVFESVNRAVAAFLLFVCFSGLARMADRVGSTSRYIGLGFERPWVRHWMSGTFCGALMVSACVACIALFGGYNVSSTEPITTGRTTAAIVISWILLTASLAEELMFRSYPFHRLIEIIRNISRAFGMQAHAEALAGWGAIAVTSILFGALHLRNPNASFWGFADTVLVGVLFGVLMVRTGSLWLLWGLHFGWNVTLGLFFGLPVSGVRQFGVLWTGIAQGPFWLTGGDYGIEASAPAAVVILAVLCGVLLKPSSEAVKGVNGIQSGRYS